MLAYQLPASGMTLADGLNEYYDRHRSLVDRRMSSPRAQEFFRCHDAAHVVFGCGITLINEAAVKIWSFWGTTAGLKLIRDYRLPEAQEIYQTLKWGDIGRTAVQAIVVVPRVMMRCGRMRKRWPWSDFDAYLATPLCELRREFGIEVMSIA